jgi:hypothetical protein
VSSLQGRAPGPGGPGGIRTHDSRTESPGSSDERAPTTCLESRRPPGGGLRLACAVTSNPGWSRRRESNPRQPAWKEQGHASTPGLIVNPSDSKIGVKPGLAGTTAGAQLPRMQSRNAPGKLGGKRRYSEIHCQHLAASPEDGPPALLDRQWDRLPEGPLRFQTYTQIEVAARGLRQGIASESEQPRPDGRARPIVSAGRSSCPDLVIRLQRQARLLAPPPRK